MFRIDEVYYPLLESKLKVNKLYFVLLLFTYLCIVIFCFYIIIIVLYLYLFIFSCLFIYFMFNLLSVKIKLSLYLSMFSNFKYYFQNVNKKNKKTLLVAYSTPER